MICCKESDKNDRFEKLCMQWAELAADVRTTHPNHIFFPSFSDKHYIYGKNK